MAEVRGGWWPAALGVARALRAQLGARGHAPTFTDSTGTLTRSALVARVRERARELRDGDQPLVVCADDARECVVEALAGWLARRTVCLVPPRAGERALRRARASTSRRPGVFFASSGSTRDPEVVVSRRGWAAAAQMVGIVGLLPRMRRPVVASLAPVGHGHGFSALLLTLALGGHFVALDKRDPLPQLRALGHVDVLTGVPLQLEEFADGIAAPPSIGLVLSGSDRLSDPGRITRTFGARVVDAYGATEAGTVALDGRPLPGVRIRERDGRLEVRSPVLGRGVFDADLGFIRGGRAHVTGSADGVRVSGGENVDPSTVRDWLIQQPGIVGVDVGELPHPRFGTVGTFVVTTSAPVGEEALRARIRREFGQAATPSRIEVLTRPGAEL